MSLHSNDISLPQNSPEVLYLTDSGLETTLIFHDKLDLREFASFELLNDPRGWDHIKAYYRRHAELSVPTIDGEQPLGFVFEGATWRANADWMDKLGYGPEQADEIWMKSIRVMVEVRDEFPHLANNYGIISGNIGPRSDGYVSSLIMTAQQAKEYHLPQVQSMKSAGADIVSAFTLNYLDEGIGICLAATDVGIPCVLSFTVETNGCLRSGESIQSIIEKVDTATKNGPAYYMINCAHPSHFIPTISGPYGDRGYYDSADTDDSTSDPERVPKWLTRIGGIRGNASKLSHAELDEAEELDDGNPVEFGRNNLDILQILPNANVFGGCCGKCACVWTKIDAYPIIDYFFLRAVFFLTFTTTKISLLSTGIHFACACVCLFSDFHHTGTDIRHIVQIRSVCRAAFLKRAQR
jgi:homocysteine S-methyltransferase